ncbi:hypothetical protein [Hymenobacter negativus]|uniref:DUF3153 domain-containing protein n=1 Tax=Hymenobacter negativus TaxID=2795026 RepID=A0ABS3QEC7_9BACT|nr:hypothetical protein [Hymenobacter negativus]MBO2009174.1 hypothetical protein [Hymenobacter negativus]
MRNLRIALFLAGALSGCSVFRSTPEQKLAQLVADNPHLVTTDTVTVTVHDTVTVAKVEFQTKYVAVPNVVREQRDSLQLDSLLNKLSASLDTAQHKAAKSNIHRLLRQRPIFPDTLCFDTLGVHGRIWQQGNVYNIRLTRDEIKTPHTAQAKAAYQRLTPCDCKPVIWYDPSTWPYLWLLAGFMGGIALCLILRRK